MISLVKKLGSYTPSQNKLKIHTIFFYISNERLST